MPRTTGPVALKWGSPRVIEKKSLNLPQTHTFWFQPRGMEMTVTTYQFLKVFLVFQGDRSYFSGWSHYRFCLTYFQHSGKFPSEQFEHFAVTTHFPGSQNQPGK